MKLYEKLIQVKSSDGDVLEVVALCSAEKAESLDQPSTHYFVPQYVVINEKRIKIEGLGYFYHPETGKSYEI